MLNGDHSLNELITTMTPWVMLSAHKKIAVMRSFYTFLLVFSPNFNRCSLPPIIFSKMADKRGFDASEAVEDLGTIDDFVARYTCVNHPCRNTKPALTNLQHLTIDCTHHFFRNMHEYDRSVHEFSCNSKDTEDSTRKACETKVSTISISYWQPSLS